MNLGRVYLRRGQWNEALRELEAGVRAVPADPDIRKMLHELRAKFN
jgi:predicted Zn-dependent protease